MSFTPRYSSCLFLFATVSLYLVMAAYAGAVTNGSVRAGQVTVTARGYDTPVSKTPGGVAIISAGDIEGGGSAGVADLSYLAPGLNSVSDAAWGSELAVRGLSRDSVIMLVDGCRVNTATAIGARFGMISLQDVEKIEVLKGPVSALYGSGSVGGVAHIVSRGTGFTVEPESGGTWSGAARNNPGGFQFYGSWGYRGPDGYAFASQSYRDYGSYKDGSGDEVDNSQFEDAQSSVRMGFKPDDNYRVEINLQYFMGRDIGIPGSGTAPLPGKADVTYPESDRILASVVNTLLSDSGILRESRLNTYYQYIKRRVVIDAFPAASPVREVRPGADHDTYGLRWFNKMVYGTHTFVSGIDAWRRTYDGSRTRHLRSGAVREDEPLPDAIYDSAGFFAEDNFSAGPKASVNLGFRGDAIIVENDENPRIEADTEQDLSYNGHIGGTYEVTDALSAKGLVARSYRAASLDERFQFLQLGGGIVKLGNPELDPEHSTFVELGLEWGAPEAFVSVSAFGNYLEDLISGRRIDETTIRNENVNQARIEGIELASTFLLADDLEAKGNFTYMEGRDTARDEYLPGIPPFNGFVSVKKGRGIGPWAELQGEFAAEQNKTPEGVRDAGGWMIFNLDAGWRWTTDRAEHTVFVGMQNIFDADYRDYLATHRGNVYDEPGRSVSLGYKAAF